jgi:hypothetical protein
MKLKTLILFSSAVGVLLAISFFIQNKYPSKSKASEVTYTTMYGKKSHEPPFTDLKCLAPTETLTVNKAFILRDLKKTSPKGVPYRDVLVAVTHNPPYQTTYILEAVDYRKGECSTYYTTVGDEEESNPLNRSFSPEQSLEIQLIWDKWRLKNVPGWRSKVQTYLNGSKVQLAKEEYLSLKQLGFTMPKKWQEVK